MSKLNAKAQPEQAIIPVPHQHHDAIVDWAKGHQMQRRCVNHPSSLFREWHDVPIDSEPGWKATWEYRKKPDPVEDIVICRQALLQSSANGDYFTHAHETTSFNVRYTFDGETKQLKNVELLK